MANTISQIRIGTNTYNIQDAVARNTLSAITNNIISLHSFFYWDWNANWLLRTNGNMGTQNCASGNNYAMCSNRCGIKLFIDPNQKINNYCGSYDASSNWQGWKGGEVTDAPEKVHQALMLLQYRFNITRRSDFGTYFVGQTVTKNIDDETNTSSDDKTGFTIQYPSRKTCTLSPVITPTQHNYQAYDNMKSMFCITDQQRIIGPNNGIIVKLAINDAHPMRNQSSEPEVLPDIAFKGVCVKEILITQGTTTTNLIPEDTESEGEEEPVENSDSTDSTD